MNECRQLARRLAFLLIYEGDMGQRSLDDRLGVLQEATALADLIEISDFYEQLSANHIAFWQKAIAENCPVDSHDVRTDHREKTLVSEKKISDEDVLLYDDISSRNDEVPLVEPANGDALNDGSLDALETPIDDEKLKAGLEALAFIDQAVRGVEAHLADIDEVVSEHARHWRITRMHSADRSILRLGMWELLFSPDAKDAALIINEAVELAKIYGEDDSYKFVNAILDAAHKKERPL